MENVTLGIEDLETLARHSTLEKNGVTITLEPSVHGFPVGDIHAPCEKVEFRKG